LTSSIFIRNASYIVTMDPRRQIISDGAIAAQGNQIIAVGKSDELAPKFSSSSEHVVDARGCVVTPGLINCHLHTAQYLARGVADNVSLPTWIHDRIYPYEASLTPSETRAASTACLVEAIKTGTTFIADPGSYHMDEVVESTQKVGARAVLARSLIDIHTPGRPIPDDMRESTDSAVSAGEDFVRRYNNHAEGRIKAWFSIRTERTTSNELARRIKEKADEYGTGIESHVANSQDSVTRHKEMFRETPLVRYHKAGLLSPNLLIIHANWLTDEEIDLVIKYNVKVVRCPTSAYVTASGTLRGGKFARLEKAGVAVALGADATPASNFLDMIRVGYSLMSYRDSNLDATLYPPEQVLETLTLNGARALLSESETGSIEIGKKADLVVFDARKPGWVPLLNPVSNLIHSASGESTRDVIIDGRIVLRDGRCLTVDEDKVREEAQKAAEDVTSRSGVRGYARSTWPMA